MDSPGTGEIGAGRNPFRDLTGCFGTSLNSLRRLLKRFVTAPAVDRPDYRRRPSARNLKPPAARRIRARRVPFRLRVLAWECRYGTCGPPPNVEAPPRLGLPGCRDISEGPRFFLRAIY